MGLRRRQQQQGPTQQYDQQPRQSGAATWARPYDTPIHASVDGQPVRILQLGDMPGMSPVFLVVDDNGDPTVVRITEVRITDGAFLPLQQQIQNNQ